MEWKWEFVLAGGKRRASEEQIQARRASEDIVCSMEFTPLPYPTATQFQGFSAPAVRSSWPGIRVFILAHPHARMKTPLRAAKFASTQITTHFFSVKSRLFARVSLIQQSAALDEHHWKFCVQMDATQ